MASGSSICPHCGGLNSIDEKTCFRCGQRLPGPVGRAAGDLLTSLLGRDFPLTKLFVILCVLVFIPIALKSSPLPMLGGARTSEVMRWGAWESGFVRHEPFRYLSAVFVHLGVLHILFNMMALTDFGRLLEQRLGWGRFAVLFVTTGILGFVISDYWHEFTGVLVRTAGASGSLFGLVGALIGHMYAARDPAWKQFLMRVIVYAAIFAFAMPVNNSAHVGGFVVGFPLGYAFYKERSPHKRNKLFNAIGVVLVLASFVSIGLSLRSPRWREVKRQELLMGID